MAQAIFDFVVGKLCEAAFEEVVALLGVDDKLKSVKRKLDRIQCFLNEADKRVSRDERVKHWVKEMKDVSVLIQEAMEMYQAEVATRKEPGIMNKIGRAIRKPRQLKAKRKLGGKIDTILALIEEITQSKEEFGIENLGERRIVESAVKVGLDRYINPDLDEQEIVGFVADKEKIIAQLLDENTPKRSLVSIVGTGGLGKTTLAQKVYSSDAVKSRFEVRAWLSISQDFNLIDLLKKILRKLRSIEEKEETLGIEYFIGEINQSLRNIKYLIVLDDVWSDRVLRQIKDALPDVENGSRVLMTSRFANIAKAVDRTFEPYELPFLSKEESLQLLLKTALPNRACPTNLLDIAEQLADKCDRLPLALVLLGGLLSRKTETRTTWGKLLKIMVWGVQGKECMNIVSTTYNDMSEPLKTCFQYLACFPEDFEIDADNLIRLWVAEEFIEQQYGSTLEDIAEDYLEQLAERHMVIVSSRRCDDSIETIRVHDILHDLAIDKAKENNFITVISNKYPNGSTSTLSTRLSLQSSDVNKLMEHAGPSLHSLHYYFRPKELPDSSRYEMLKVCNIESAGNWEFGHLQLERSNHLRFLRVAGYHVSLHLPVGQLRNIQTIDLSNASCIELPEFIWGIETLRHVILIDFDKIRGPPSWAKLKNLQTLGFVQESNSWGTQLPHLINVRCLELQIRKLTSAKTIASLLQTLDNLISLTLVLPERTIVKGYHEMKFESNKVAVVGEESASDDKEDESGSDSMPGSDSMSDDSDLYEYASHEKYEEELSELEGYPVLYNEVRNFIFIETNTIVNMQAFPFYRDLQNLELKGWWVDSFDRPGVSLPPNLVSLRIEATNLLIDPMATLEKLEFLKELYLGYRCYDGEKMICLAGGFPSLKQLTLSDLKGLVELKIEEGAMATLNILIIEDCEKLRRLNIKKGAMPCVKQLELTECGRVACWPWHPYCIIKQIYPYDEESDEAEESDADDQ